MRAEPALGVDEERIAEAASELRVELERKPLRDDIAVSVIIGNCQRFILKGGQLLQFNDPLQRQPCDVEVTFRDPATLADGPCQGPWAYS